MLNLGANRFHFEGPEVDILYETSHGGPLQPGENPTGGQLSYDGPEGKFHASGVKLTEENSVLGGAIVSFAIGRPGADFVPASMLLLVPSVRLADGNAELHSVAIKSARRSAVGGAPQQQTYSVIALSGTASTTIAGRGMEA